MLDRLSNFEVYMRALHRSEYPSLLASDAEILDFAGRFPSLKSENLRREDLCCLAFFHGGFDRLNMWAQIVPPSPMLVAVAADDPAHAGQMLKQWQKLRPVILHDSLAPFLPCFLFLALRPEEDVGEDFKELVGILGVNAQIPSLPGEIKWWLTHDAAKAPAEDVPLPYSRPLHRAFEVGAFGQAQWLMQQGADPWIRDCAGQTALEALTAHIEELKEKGSKEPLEDYQSWHTRLSAMWEQKRLEEAVARPKEAAKLRL